MKCRGTEDEEDEEKKAYLGNKERTVYIIERKHTENIASFTVKSRRKSVLSI